MNKIIKIFFLSCVVISLTIFSLYTFYKEKVTKNIQQYISNQLSYYLSKKVYIGNIDINLFDQLSINYLTINKKEQKEETLLDINKLNFSIDLYNLLRHKKTKAIINVEGLYSNEMLCNIKLQITFKRFKKFKDIFNPLFIKSISIIDAVFSTKNIILSNIYGILEINNCNIEKGKIYFEHNKIGYSLNFSNNKEQKQNYNILLHSQYLEFKSYITKNEKDIIINNLRGMFYVFFFNLKGKIENYHSNNRTCILEGTTESNLKTFNILPGKIGTFAKTFNLSGWIKSHIQIEAKHPHIKNWNITSTISANDLKLENFYTQKKEFHTLEIKNIMTKLSLKNGKITSPLVNGNIYRGDFTANIDIDINQKDIPYIIAMSINNLKIEKLLEDFYNKKTALYGDFTLDMLTKGSLKNLKNVEGNGNIIIKEANLGKMPILIPLLGRIYAIINKLIPNIRKVNINQATTEFEIKNQKINSEKIVLLGNEILINAKGYLGFDGKLDFTLENELRKDLDLIQSNISQISLLRNIIIQFGKFIGKAKLSGTLKKPEWNL